MRDVRRVVTAGADHMISDFTLSILMAECSFKCYSSKECGVSRRYSAQTAIVPLKTCTKDVLPHLRGCYKTTAKGVDFEWRLCLYRAGLFQEDGDCLTICPLHRDEFGLGWRPSKACKYPLHDMQTKTDQRNY